VNIVLDLNVITQCRQHIVSHTITEKIEAVTKWLDKLYKAIARIKRGEYIYLPHIQWKALEENIQEALKKNVHYLPQTFLSLTIHIKPYCHVREECKNIEGYCGEEYKRICSAIVAYSRQSLLAIVCTGKTFSEEHLKEIVRDRDRCSLKPTLNHVYIVSCSISEDVVSALDDA
jgi:hypothetical protein